MTTSPDIFADISADQEHLLRVIYRPALEHGRWPVWRYVDSTYSQAGKSALDVLRSLPAVRATRPKTPKYGLVHYAKQYLDQDLIDSTVMRLTLAAALHLPAFQRVGEDFVRALQVFIDEAAAPSSNPFEVEPLTITNEELGQRIAFSPTFDLLMPDLLWNEPMNLASGSGRDLDTGNWQLTLNREVLRELQGVKDLKDYVERVVAWLQPVPDHGESSVIVTSSRFVAPIPDRATYVDQALIEKLRAVQAVTKWNLKKLLQLLSELNDNYDNENVYSCHALLRAILDHVPPIFGQGTFGSVIDQYAWGRTDKNYMKRLGEFRAQGDDTMHRPASRREDTLSFHDLPARAAVNRLVSEVIAILESEASSM